MRSLRVLTETRDAGAFGNQVTSAGNVNTRTPPGDLSLSIVRHYPNLVRVHFSGSFAGVEAELREKWRPPPSRSRTRGSL